MNSPLLSICIPTFKRHDCLKVCLSSITEQFSDQAVKDKVEIVISDNASPDATSAVVQEFQKTFSNIVYKKNETNFGVDRNILQVVEMSSGKYVWLLGDDDALFPGALKHVLNFLEQGQADYIIANCWGYNKALTEKALNQPNFHISQNKFYNTLADYVKQATPDNGLVGLFCGLSTQIFLKQPWLNVVNKEKYIGTNAVHLHTLMSAFKNTKFCLLSKPLVMVRADNIRWDVFEGLETLKKRTQLSEKTLVWILETYQIPYSKLKLKLGFAYKLFVDQLQIVARKYFFRSQKTRDFIKKIMGKM